MNLEIPRQTAARRQVRRVRLEVEATHEGYVVWSPDAPGWKAAVTTNPQAGQALHDALVEAQIAAYARAHDASYDHAALTSHDPLDPSTAFAQKRRSKGSRVSPGWSENEDGTLTSPSGNVYARHTRQAQQVLAGWRQAELAAAAPSTVTPSEGVTSGAEGPTGPPDGPDRPARE